MEKGICPYCQTEEIMWYWEIEPNQWVAVCECCRRAITKAEIENERELTIFITIDEYNAMKELEGGCLGIRLTQ